MAYCSKAWLVLSLLTLVPALHADNTPDVARRANAVCSAIQKQISSASGVYYIASANYVTDSQHYISSSSQNPACVVEVGSTDDTSIAIKVIGSKRSPFAVISGGHASNPGFSSTTGVLISMARMKQIIPASNRKTVVIGSGNVWATDVYPALDKIGYNVVGGRVTGPAVGGFSLGGGFSWLTNQYGLTCDTVISYTLVLPNGTISEVTSAQKDLFFALKGGMNRFGILTQIKLKLYPQVPQVWGGYQVYSPTSIPALLDATANFSNTNKDPKAQVITTISYLASAPEAVLLLFYDGPAPGPSLKPFTQLPGAIYSDVSTRSFASLAASAPTQESRQVRGAFHTLSTKGYTKGLLDAIHNQTTHYGALAALHTGVYISYDIEPFLPTFGRFATDSAYPHANSPLPLNLYFTWTSPTEDAFWRGKMQESVDYLAQVAQAEGVYDASMTAYPNYALSAYGGDRLYGSANAERLRGIQSKVDPKRVMELSGGFTI